VETLSFCFVLAMLLTTRVMEMNGNESASWTVCSLRFDASYYINRFQFEMILLFGLYEDL
jgi:hypothetical protein